MNRKGNWSRSGARTAGGAALMAAAAAYIEVGDT